MITVVDSNVLIDLLSGTAGEIRAAENAVRVTGRQGRLLFPTICYAELAGRFKNRRSLDEFLDIVPVRLLPMDADAGYLAGIFHREYRARGGTRSRVLADFVVAAQTQLSADRLLTTDKRFFGTSFPKLIAVSPAELAP